jgi:ABC-type multidrug transport system ATPase subunit
VIEAIDLTVRRRGRTVLDAVSFDVRPGQVTGVLGGTGAGKTTLLRRMVQLEHGGGETLFDGIPYRALRHPMREVGLLLDPGAGHPDRTVRGQLRLALATDRRAAREAAAGARRGPEGGDARRSSGDGDARRSSRDGEGQRTSGKGDVRRLSGDGDVRRSSSDGDVRHLSGDGDVRRLSSDGDVRHLSGEGDIDARRLTGDGEAWHSSGDGAGEWVDSSVSVLGGGNSVSSGSDGGNCDGSGHGDGDGGTTGRPSGLAEAAVASRRSRLADKLAASRRGRPADRIDAVLDIVGLTEQSGTRLADLTDGMATRLAIAVALLGDPKALLFDCPERGLEPEGVAWLGALLRAFTGQGRAALVTGSDTETLVGLTDRILLLDHGYLVGTRTAEEVLRAPTGAAVIVRSPQIVRFAAILAEAGARSSQGDGACLEVRGLDRARVGDLAYRNGIPVHELSERFTGSDPADLVLAACSGRDRPIVPIQGLPVPDSVLSRGLPASLQPSYARVGGTRTESARPSDVSSGGAHLSSPRSVSAWPTGERPNNVQLISSPQSQAMKISGGDGTTDEGMTAEVDDRAVCVMETVKSVDSLDSADVAASAESAESAESVESVESVKSADAMEAGR